MPSSRPFRPGFFHGLSFRLLLLTVFFVMVAELLIWTPSVARYRKGYLDDVVARAHISMVAIETMPDRKVDKALEDALLYHTDAYGIVLDRPERRMLMVSRDMPPDVDMTVGLHDDSFFGWIRQAFSTLLQNENRVLRVVGMSPKDKSVTVEVLIDEAPMRAEMLKYSGRILNLSIVISLFTATLVYFSLQLIMVRPMRRITESMSRFRAQPEDPARIITASSRPDEIGITERELAVMQDELRQALQQKTRLAALGAAVAKVNHDLRNSLATAMLASDRLADIDDPEVKRVLPRLLAAIDRAVGLCSQTLNFVSDARIQLDHIPFTLRTLVEEAGQSVAAAIEGKGAMTWVNAVPDAVTLEADREQLYRVLTNLGQNAFEAGAARCRIEAEQDGDWVRIDVGDDGPGFSAEARENLFRPFAGSAKDGGTGLGLVIVRDIVRAHGGDVFVIDGDGESGGAGDSRGAGTTVRLRLPARKHEPAGDVPEDATADAQEDVSEDAKAGA